MSGGVGSTEPPNSGGAGFAGAEAESQLSFEQAQKELEQIVERLERGEADLDETLALWQRGEELYRLCRERLEGAQGRIEELRGPPRDKQR